VPWGSCAPNNREQTWPPVRGTNLDDFAVENSKWRSLTRMRIEAMTDIEVPESYTDHDGGEFSAVTVRVVATWSASILPGIAI
jgi:hypothetical protein